MNKKAQYTQKKNNNFINYNKKIILKVLYLELEKQQERQLLLQQGEQERNQRFTDMEKVESKVSNKLFLFQSMKVCVILYFFDDLVQFYLKFIQS